MTVKKFTESSGDGPFEYDVGCQPDFIDDYQDEIRFGKVDFCIVKGTILELLTSSVEKTSQDYFTIMLMITILAG